MSTFHDDLEEFEVENNLDFLTFNKLNLTNYTANELIDTQNSTNNFLKKIIFTTKREKKRTFFIINNMHKLLWLTNSFKYSITASTNIYLHRYRFLNLNYSIQPFFAKIYFPHKNLIIYQFTYLNYLKIFFFLKFFFISFG